jgi:hypothetical protein
MPQCPRCRHDIIEAVGPGNATVILDAHAKTYMGCDVTHLFPEDGDRVVLSLGLVEHAAVCRAVREAEAQQRAQGRTQYRPRTHGTNASP